MALFLTRHDVQQAVGMVDAIEAVEGAFIALSTGKAYAPVRLSLPVPEQNAAIHYMPAYLPTSAALGAKIVSTFPHNPEIGKATVQAVLVVSDPSTGETLAIMEGGYLTALRTAAASGVASRHLARPDARVVAIFGAGVQGRTQLEAVCAVRDIETVWVYDLNGQAADRYASEMSMRGGRVPSDVRVASSPVQAVSDADIICTSTPSRQPLFSDTDLKAGVHINAIGGFTPEMQEIPPDTVARARIVVDCHEACMAEAGDLIIPLNHGMINREQCTTELGHVAAGVRPGRTSSEQVTLFKSVGNAVQDVSVAQLVVQRARSLGLGVEVSL